MLNNQKICENCNGKGSITKITATNNMICLKCKGIGFKLEFIEELDNLIGLIKES